ncbi:MAG: DeoR/GlpR transcriptional regulator [Ruminococcaceae bacterium]|nr:DeoR/GlpR transcriptional regulator [Oscillospiraceae bacterium]
MMKYVKINIRIYKVNILYNIVLNAERSGVMTEERREKIRVLLSEKPFVSLAELCSMFPSVSDMTIRRDIEYFEKIGAAIKVRGGARSVKFIGDTTEESIASRMNSRVEEKTKIAKAAARYLEPGRSIFVDSGSTVGRLSYFLPSERLTFTTTSPSIALELCKTGVHVVNIVGGRVDRDNFSVSGMYAMKFISDMNIDVAFLCPSGLSLSGSFTCGNYSECELKSTVAKKARLVVMLMDKTKVDKMLPFTFCGMEDVDVLVTDGKLPEELERKAKESGTRIIDVSA